MSYSQALNAAGAEVLAFKEFGSYQGDWWAKVVWGEQTGWVNGSYGSCSGCDAFESEFGYGAEFCDEHRHTYDTKITDVCSDCIDEQGQYDIKLASFGKVYLEGMYSFEEAVKQASRYIDWDSDAPEMVEWIKSREV